MRENKKNPKVYTTQEGIERLKVEASTFNLYNYYPLLVPECRCQAWLFLTDIFGTSHDFSTGGISHLKCTVESDLIYRINNRAQLFKGRLVLTRG